MSPISENGASVNAEAGSASEEAAILIEANSVGSISVACPSLKGTRLAGVRVDWAAIPTVEHAATAAAWSWKLHWAHAPQVMVDRVPPQTRHARPCVADGSVVIYHGFGSELLHC